MSVPRAIESRFTSRVVRGGTVIAAFSLCVLAAMDVQALGGGLQSDSTLLRAPAVLGLRVGFVVMAVGILATVRPASSHWRFAVRGAAAMLACCVGGELYGVLAERSIAADLGPIDDVARRLFRLAQMAALAVPLLALLAAREVVFTPVTRMAGSSRITRLLLLLEPLLFAIGATTLATILAAAAFVHVDIAWALPIGADTTVLACIAAAVRAAHRRDRTALVGWAAVAGSMVVGLLMGVYAFGGPMPTPAVIGDYASLARTVLRDMHIIVLSLGITAIALRTARS